jgi:pimeloyl-ACP methyl ester carboxylesterase
MKQHRLLALVLASCAVCATGCSQTNFTASERYEHGLVVVLDGAGGITAAPQQICQGLNDGGVNQALEIFPWSAAHDVLADQTDLERNRGKGAELAARVVRYLNEYPGRPVHLIGLSAGTGIVVFAAEQLPEGVQIDGICLMASSLSSTYPLMPALRHVRYELTNFSSVADVGVLGAAVTVTGTVDRNPGLSAGLLGFQPPEGASEEIRQFYKTKVVEVPWNPVFIVYGNIGDHLWATSSGFVRDRVAPIIRAAERRRAAPVLAPTRPVKAKESHE